MRGSDPRRVPKFCTARLKFAVRVPALLVDPLTCPALPVASHSTIMRVPSTAHVEAVHHRAALVRGSVFCPCNSQRRLGSSAYGFHIDPRSLVLAKEELIEMDGTVDEVLPDSRFRVILDNGHAMTAY